MSFIGHSFLYALLQLSFKRQLAIRLDLLSLFTFSYISIGRLKYHIHHFAFTPAHFTFSPNYLRPAAALHTYRHSKSFGEMPSLGVIDAMSMQSLRFLSRMVFTPTDDLIQSKIHHVQVKLQEKGEQDAKARKNAVQALLGWVPTPPSLLPTDTIKRCDEWLMYGRLG